jgi:hypothetical protein
MMYVALGILVCERNDRVADLNYSTGHDFGAQPAAMNQTAHHTLSGQFLQMRAWLAQARAPQDDLADAEFSFDEMIQRDAARDDIAARMTWSHVDVVIPFERLDGFDFDQRHVATRTRIIGISSQFVEIAISFEPAPSDGFHLIHRLHRCRARRRDVKRNDGALGAHGEDCLLSCDQGGNFRGLHAFLEETTCAPFENLLR